MMGLTARQQACFDFIRAYHAENGITPTIQEISNQFGWVSKSNAARVVDGLEQRGYIRTTPRLARSIEIISPETRRAVLLSKEVFHLVQAYASSQRISVDCAASELLREAMGAA